MWMWENKIISFIVNFLIFITTIVICFLALELFFKWQIKWSNNAQSAVNLPIFEKSNYRSWNMKPFAEAVHWFWSPTPTIKINSDWLRWKEIPKDKTKKRILLLWDSFVFWMWAYQNQTIDRFLNEKYTWEKYTRAINWWIIGQTVDDAFLYLKNDWINLKPDIVVYHFFVWNDITELRRHNQSFDEKWNLIKTKDSVHEITKEWFLRKKWKKEPKSYFFLWLNNRLNPDLKSPTLTWPVFFSDNSPNWDLNLSTYWWKYFEFLKEMNEYCLENNIKFIVNIIPMDVQVSEKYWKKYPKMPFWKEEFELKRPQKRIISLMKNEWIEYIDLLPIFQDIEKLEKTTLYFEKDPHFNKWWSMWAANSIYLYLLSKNYL